MRLDLDLWKARFADWLELKLPSKDSMHNYTSKLRPFLEFVTDLGLSSWTEVNRDVLETYRAEVLAARHIRTQQPLTSGSHVARLMAVKTFFRFLSEEGYLLVDPSLRLQLPRRRQPLPAVLSEEEVGLLLATPDVTTEFGLRDRTILELLYGTALRNGELCSLTLNQLDLAQHLIRLQQGKGNKGRVVPLGQEAQGWLERYLSEVRPVILREPRCDALFLDRWGQRALLRTGLTAIVRFVAQAANIRKEVTPHTLRRSCATHMLRRGAGLRHIQKLLGHAQLSSTEHYTRVEVSDLRRLLLRCHPREQQS